MCFLSFVSVALNAGFDMLQFWVWWVQTRARAEELCSCREKQRGGLQRLVRFEKMLLYILAA